MKRDNALLLGASFLIAIGVRFALGSSIERQREIEVKVEYANLPSTLTLVGEPTTIPVIASAAQEHLNEFKADSITAIVDLTRATVGLRGYVVALPTTQGRVTLQPKHQVLRLDVQKVSSIEVGIEIEPSGLPSSEFVYDGATVLPERTTIVGPESLLSRVKKVRAPLSLESLKPGASVTVPVEILDEGMRRIPFLRARPAEVTVNPALASAPATRRLLVSPRWIGQPQFGFKVLDYEVRPAQVQVGGSPGVLAGVTTLETEPVNLSGLTTEVTRTVRLDLPPGLTAVGPDTVQVVVRIGPARGQGTPPN